MAGIYIGIDTGRRTGACQSERLFNRVSEANAMAVGLLGCWFALLVNKC